MLPHASVPYFAKSQVVCIVTVYDQCMFVPVMLCCSGAMHHTIAGLAEGADVPCLDMLKMRSFGGACSAAKWPLT